MIKQTAWIIAVGLGCVVASSALRAEEGNTTAACNCAACQTAQPGCPDGDGCKPPEPWKLPQPCCLQQMGITVGGWLEQGITFNGGSPSDQYNGPNATNDRDHEYQLNQFWLYFVKPTKTDGCGTDWGGRVDLSYGTDWRFGQCPGLETRIDSPNQFYGLIIPQFYFEVAINDLTVKMGHFATMSSLEVIPAPMNFFYSHSLLSSGYFDPLLVTGVQADYKLNDNWTAFGGANNGWLAFEDPTGSWNFLGGVKWASDDKKANLSVMVDSGPEVGFSGLHDRLDIITVFTYQLSERLQYGSQYTVGRETQASLTKAGAEADWYGLEQMLIYKLCDKWSAGARYEWVRDEDGARVAGVGTLMGTNKGWQCLPGMAGSYHDVSLGLNYRPNANWVLRPEARWDFFNGNPNGAGQLPYINKTKTEQFTFAMDLILTY